MMTSEEKYLDYLNNFLTIEAFAEYYGMKLIDAIAFINSQRIAYKEKYFL